MDTARVFKNGRSQAVRLPKKYRLPQEPGDDVYVQKIDGMVILIPKGKPWEHLQKSLGLFTDDFMDEREQPPQQERGKL
ncbi:MAG: antitoxin [Candidatus Brocadiia bacterium]